MKIRKFKVRRSLTWKNVLNSLGLKQRKCLINLLNARLIRDNVALFKSDCIYHEDEEDVEVGLNRSLFEWIKRRIQNMNRNNRRGRYY